MTKPEFTFERSMRNDVVIVGISHEGDNEVFEIEGMAFELGAVSSLPDRFMNFANEFSKAISEFLLAERNDISEVVDQIEGLT